MTRAEAPAPRKQCASCPWKRSVDPDSLPAGYGRVDRDAVTRASASGAASLRDRAPGMGCHVPRPGPVLPCVGWLAQQLGPGGDLGLRMAVVTGHVDANVETVGPQRATLARRA